LHICKKWWTNYRAASWGIQKIYKFAAGILVHGCGLYFTDTALPNDKYNTEKFPLYFIT
jgi:hypothetical protein